MAVGLTDAGFVARQQSEIEEELIARLQSDDDLAGLNFRAGPMHQIVAIVAELLAQAWEAAEEVYGSQYATASGVSLDRVAELTGTRRRAATRSTVSATCNLAASTTLPAGSIAAVDGSPDSQFRSVEVATNALGVAANVAVLFESVETGPVAAPSGTLTVIPSPVTGSRTRRTRTSARSSQTTRSFGRRASSSSPARARRPRRRSAPRSPA